jgi:DNA polymerase III alpha subunit (gram-positive type)
VSRPEIYVSVDIETDGPCPGINSMLSVGAVAFDRHGVVYSTFYRTLSPLEGASQHSKTMQWWVTKPKAWAATQLNQKPPQDVMTDFLLWVRSLPGNPVFVGYPAGFDFTFVYWYFHRFTGDCPFGFAAIDMKSFAMALLGSEFRGTTKRTMPKEWFSKAKHTHHALDDAIEQAAIFTSMLAFSRDREVNLKGESFSSIMIDDPQGS